MSSDETRVRYMVNDVGGAGESYTRHFRFEPLGPSGPAFAAGGNLRLLLSAPNEQQMTVGDPSGHLVERFQPVAP